MKRLAILLLPVFLVGCAATANIEAEFKPGEQKISEGPNTIQGEAFMRKRSGGTVNCGGNEAFVTKDTAYAAERMEKIYGSTGGGVIKYGQAMFKPSMPENEKYMEMSKKDTCNSEGEFSFEELEDGTYFVVANVRWNPSGGPIPEGGNIMKRVSVEDGETKEVILSP